MALIEVNFPSETLHRQVTYRAIVPVETPQSSSALPTLYLLHGVTGDQNNWLTRTRIAALAERRGIAVIMPNGDNSFYVDQPGALDYYGEYVGRELVEESRRLFPLSDRRQDTWIGGLSMGGYGAIRNGLKYPETFGAIIGLSSALITYRASEATDDAEWPFGRRSYYEAVFGDLAHLPGSDKDVEALAQRLYESGISFPRLYLACGTEDPLLGVNRRYRDYLRHLGVPFKYVEASGQHDWAFWDTYIEQALDWLGEPASAADPR